MSIQCAFLDFLLVSFSFHCHMIVAILNHLLTQQIRIVFLSSVHELFYYFFLHSATTLHNIVTSMKHTLHALIVCFQQHYSSLSAYILHTSSLCYSSCIPIQHSVLYAEHVGSTQPPFSLEIIVNSKRHAITNCVTYIHYYLLMIIHRRSLACIVFFNANPLPLSFFPNCIQASGCGLFAYH